MAISLRAAATTGTTAVAAPTGTANGDFLIATATSSDISAPGAFTWPAGWTVLGSISGGASFILRMEVATWDWATGNATSWSVTGARTTVCAGYVGVDTSSTGFIAQAIGTVSSSVSSKATSSVTNTNAGSWRVCCFASSAAGSATTWNSYSPADTERAEKSAASASSTFSDSTLTDSNGPIATGATSVTGTLSGSAAGAGAWIGLLLPVATPLNPLLWKPRLGPNYRR